MIKLPPDKRTPNRSWTIIRINNDPSDLRIFATYYDDLKWSFSTRIVRVTRFKDHARVTTKAGSVYTLKYSLEQELINPQFQGKMVKFDEVIV